MSYTYSQEFYTFLTSQRPRRPKLVCCPLAMNILRTFWSKTATILDGNTKLIEFSAARKGTTRCYGINLTEIYILSCQPPTKKYLEPSSHTTPLTRARRQHQKSIVTRSDWLYRYQFFFKSIAGWRRDHSRTLAAKVVCRVCWFCRLAEAKERTTIGSCVFNLWGWITFQLLNSIQYADSRIERHTRYWR